MEEHNGLPYPPAVERAAARHNLSPALAFGLGEGLNLYYSRRAQERPPHLLHVLPSTFDARLAERLAAPREMAIPAALAGNGYGVMICTGDWHGLDAIEKWGEELSRWPLLEGWESSVAHFAGLIEQSDGLYRRSYRPFLALAEEQVAGWNAPHLLLEEIADGWLHIAAALRRGDSLERLGSRVLRMAALESRFWGQVLDRFGAGI